MLKKLLFLATVMLMVSNIVNAQGGIKPKFGEPAKADSTQTLLSSKTRLNTNDSTTVFVPDSNYQVVADTLQIVDTVDIADKSEIEDVIEYSAEDSMIYDLAGKKMYLFNGADVKYQKIKLKGNLVDFDWNTFTLMSQGSLDSAGQLTGTPVFSDGGNEYKARKMAYNFKTKKGKVYEVVTHEGDSYIHSEEVKRNEYEEWFGKNSKYTTCDLDHPHFYFKAKKVKMVPNKVMVTGPANLWLGDVPTPLVVPFGIFPAKQGKRSGIVMPEYGQDAQLGFFLRNGGYFWAVNDYLSLKLTTLVSTNGTFGATVGSQYALNYKFNGNFSVSYTRTRPQDPDIPGAKAVNAYAVAWSHQQNPKSMPNSNFGAQVQIQSADYYSANRVTDQRLFNTAFFSSINYSHNFARTPLSLSVNLRHDQNLLSRTISFLLPTIRLAMSRVSPFKRKIQTGKPQWYENIGISYSLEFSNRLSTYDSTLFKKSSLDKFRFGFNQTFNVDAPFTLFKYINVSPSFNYQERTYFRTVNKTWDPDTIYIYDGDTISKTIYGQVITDTIWNFASNRNFSTGVSFSTKLTGIYNFKNKIIKGLRHVFTPSVSFNYQPDFASKPFKYYRSVQSNSDGRTEQYSIYGNNDFAIYGSPGQGTVGSVNWTLANNFEMKVFSKKDTVTHEKKMGLLDQVNLSGGYNFAADSLRLLPFNLNIASNRVFNIFNVNFNATFNPYTTDSLNRPINTFEWTKSRRLLRFSNANVSVNAAFQSKPRAARTGSLPDEEAPKFVSDYVSYDANRFYDFEIPWSFNIGYRFNLSKGTYFNPDTLIASQSITATADFNITPHWKVNVSSGFDVNLKQPTLTNLAVVRDLHCWELSFNWTPLPLAFQQFAIILQVKSGTLKDLKVQRRRTFLQD